VTLSFRVPFASNFEISVEIVFHNFVDFEIRCLVLCGVGNSVSRARRIRNLSNRRYMLTKNTTKACTQSSLSQQESRRRRDDDFGETDDEAGGVRVDGYVKKSPSKNTFKFFSLMPETLVAKATGKTEKVATWWDKLFGRRAVRKLRDSTWLDGLK